MSGNPSASSESARSRSPSQQRPAKPQHRHSSIVCKPLDSLDDIKEFLNDPPAWRSLCTELRPHSDYVIKNIDIVRQNHNGSDVDIQLENPETFCHFTLDKEDVRRHHSKHLPKTLVCHDMANGYHDDCHIDGTGNDEAYSFYNWAVVDIFCYFSHHFITIPPLGWINVAHAHGVKVIGTVITEWAEGAAIWEHLLAAPDHWQEFARSLVAIAKTLRFDGWLLNIENQISRPAELVQFVRQLHSLLHAELPAPLLLWYDSVTQSGHLAWQNQLNHNNLAFFSACDGIFTNYAWRARDVAASVATAGERRCDVFVGLDVWGRNFLGGGQFNTQEAAKIVHKHGCSMAIFAPAWTLEDMRSEPRELDSFRRWRLRERALWGSLWPLLRTRLPRALPWASGFCAGQGTRRRLYGEVSEPGPWYNLRHQQYQPNSSPGSHGYRLAPAHTADTPDHTHTADTPDHTHTGDDTALPPDVTLAETPKVCKKEYRLQYVKEAACMELYLQDSFTGGGCLLIDSGEHSDRLVRLLHCDFTIEDTLIACVVSKPPPEREAQVLDLVLSVREEDGTERRMVLGGSGAGVRSARGERFKDVQRYLLLHQPDFYVSVENSDGWKVRYYSVRVRGRVTSVSARGAALLGHLGLCHRMENKNGEEN